MLVPVETSTTTAINATVISMHSNVTLTKTWKEKSEVLISVISGVKAFNLIPSMFLPRQNFRFSG